MGLRTKKKKTEIKMKIIKKEFKKKNSEYGIVNRNVKNGDKNS